MGPEQNEERAVLRYQLRTQLEATENQIESLPQQRANAKANQTQAEMMARQNLRNAEAEKMAVQSEIERLQDQGRQQLAALDAQRLQLEAQRQNAQEQLERPDERLNVPRQVIEQQLDQISSQLASLPVQRSNVEAQTGAQLQGPQERLRMSEVAEAQAKGQEEEAAATFSQQEGSIEAQEIQLNGQLGSLRQRLNELETEEQKESGVAEEERERARLMEQRIAELDQKLSETTAINEAVREEVGASGASELATAYGEEADRHAAARKLWLVILSGAIVLAGAVGAGAIALAEPGRQATNREIATAVAIEILAVGLAIYVVRVAAGQFRAHSHLEAVSRSKAAALATFNRIVAGPAEPEVRTAVAAVLAQAVFGGGETGFIDGGADNVTLIERAVAPVLQRLGSP